MANPEQNAADSAGTESPPVQPAQPAQPAPPASRRGGIWLRLFGWILLAAILAAAGGGFYYLLDQRLKAEHAAVEAQIQDWEARIESALGGVDGVAAFEAKLEQHLQEVEARRRASLAALQDRLQETAGALADTELRHGDLQAGMAAARTEIAALGARLEALERNRQQRTDVLVALVRLARAADLSAPFPNALAAFERASGDSAAPALGQAARAGVPSWRSLAGSFPEAARIALSVQSPAPPGTDGNFWERVRTFFAGLVTIRSGREIAGDTPAARISQAEARLEEGDPAAALAALDRLPIAVRESMAGWIASARLRLEVETEIGRLLDARLGSGS